MRNVKRVLCIGKQATVKMSTTKTNDSSALPSLIVFDLDDCLWTPEMHELSGMPEIPVFGKLDSKGTKGVVGLQVPRYKDTVTLHKGARKVLHELATNPIYKDVQLATASTSLEPSYSYACLQGIEILPNLSMGEMMSYNQIGRTGILSSDKITHFRLLHEESGIPYNEMLFFDDCNWGDHCGRVSKKFGVVSQRTPHGLQWKEFINALAKYKRTLLR